ncbi:MAG: SpoIID/LytB domain-containing protein [Elusimicrobia bacterium]|nr:SpoIID/LytB domain-containing protein [Elusimicrobiota bacterium]
MTSGRLPPLAAGLLTCALAVFARAAAGDAAGRARVQIAIVRQASSARIVPDGGVALVAPEKAAKPLEWKGELRLKPREGGLRLADLNLKSETRLVPGAGARVKVDGNYYRGALILRLDPGQTVTVIEEIPLEDYLEGVLPHEMDPNWPLESLKAQAVVARTFAYANMGKFRKDGFDLTADTRSQVYRGLTLVNENVRAAVRQTRGEVLGYNGKLMRVYYHACCGGATTDAGAAWGSEGESLRPLKGVKDPWCRASPHMSWSAYFTWADLTAAIAERHALTGPLRGLRISARDAAGYVREFLAKTSGGTTGVRAADLRTALGAGEMKSVRIRDLAVRKKGVEFFGSGLGHGVGLCQWGARLQADTGRDYDQILRFYFPGATLSEVDE